MIINRYKIDYTGGSSRDPKIFLKGSSFDNTKIYSDFMRKKCYEIMPTQPDFEIILTEKKDNLAQLTEIIDKINLDKKFIFIEVTYNLGMFHVAGILINTEKKIIEYVDSMPADQSKDFDQELREFINNNEKLKTFKYHGLNEVYGSYNFYPNLGYGEYDYPPPQNTENQLIGTAYRAFNDDLKNDDDLEYFESLKSNESLQNFIKNYNSSAGGTCKFWTYHIINKVVENNTTVINFVRSADWYRSTSYLEIGLKAIKYIINEITNNVLNCVKFKLKN